MMMGLLVSLTFAWNETVVPPAQKEFLRLRATAVEDARQLPASRYFTQ